MGGRRACGVYQRTGYSRRHGRGHGGEAEAAENDETESENENENADEKGVGEQSGTHGPKAGARETRVLNRDPLAGVGDRDRAARIIDAFRVWGRRWAQTRARQRCRLRAVIF